MPRAVIYTLSLHDALPIYDDAGILELRALELHRHALHHADLSERRIARRSEEHTSELQSHSDLVCRLLLEKKKSSKKRTFTPPVIASRRRTAPIATVPRMI